MARVPTEITAWLKECVRCAVIPSESVCVDLIQCAIESGWLLANLLADTDTKNVASSLTPPYEIHLSYALEVMMDVLHEPVGVNSNLYSVVLHCVGNIIRNPLDDCEGLELTMTCIEKIVGTHLHREIEESAATTALACTPPKVRRQVIADIMREWSPQWPLELADILGGYLAHSALLEELLWVAEGFRFSSEMCRSRLSACLELWQRPYLTADLLRIVTDMIYRYGDVQTYKKLTLTSLLDRVVADKGHHVPGLWKLLSKMSMDPSDYQKVLLSMVQIVDELLILPAQNLMFWVEFSLDEPRLKSNALNVDDAVLENGGSLYPHMHLPSRQSRRLRLRRALEYINDFLCQRLLYTDATQWMLSTGGIFERIAAWANPKPTAVQTRATPIRIMSIWHRLVIDRWSFISGDHLSELIRRPSIRLLHLSIQFGYNHRMKLPTWFIDFFVKIWDYGFRPYQDKPTINRYSDILDSIPNSHEVLSIITMYSYRVASIQPTIQIIRYPNTVSSGDEED
jgi:hypothetical protein